jgi:DNA-binding MarR family transcriptional regulator
MATLEEETARFLEAWMGVRQIVQAANFNQFHRAGLSATQFMIMNVVPAEGTTLSELALRLNLSPATLSQTLDSLEERGLLRRARSSADARKVNLSVTARGKKMQNSASKEFHRTMASLFSTMNGRGRGAMISGLEQLIRASKEARSGEEGAATRRADVGPRAARSSRQSRRK